METVGIIGGTGLYDLPGFSLVEKHEVDTPFGKPSAPIIELEYKGASVFFLARHGEHHEILPHELNSRANVFALKKLGVTTLLCLSAVGSLKEEVAPGDYLLPDQLIDWTSRKSVSFCGEGLVGHPASADPFSDDLSEVIAAKLAESVATKVHRGGAYICIEGPHLSTRAESNIYRSFGASIIGMTACPEVKLAFEAQLKCSLIGLVSDYDTWHAEEEDVSVATVLETLKTSTEVVKSNLPALVDLMRETPRTEANKQQLKSALMIAPDSPEFKEVLSVLLS